MVRRAFAGLLTVVKISGCMVPMNRYSAVRVRPVMPSQVSGVPTPAMSW